MMENDQPWNIKSLTLNNSYRYTGNPQLSTEMLWNICVLFTDLYTIELTEFEKFLTLYS